MTLSRMLALSFAAYVLILPAFGPASAQGNTEKPALRSAKERSAMPQADATNTTAPGGLTREQRVTICLETWDAQTHMTRREWRIACERSVQVDPGIFR